MVSFNLAGNGIPDDGSFVLPLVIVLGVLFAGALCFLSERKKARGHWLDKRKLR